MKDQDNCIELDGSQGEGGGQILRTALTLSMITGTPFRIERIRARRSKPGLLRQHLTAVLAAAEVCSASVDGAVIGSQALSFKPGPICGGNYSFAIGTAGSCTLVLQTILPALWFADGPSQVTVSGGTHNSMAPPADFLCRAWLPLVRQMGAVTELELKRHGFCPAGGGELVATVTPTPALTPLSLGSRGEIRKIRAEAIVAGVPYGVARRELERICGQIAYVDTRVRELPAREGPGNAVLIEIEHDGVTEIFSGFGEKGTPAETVADRVARQARHYLASQACVGEHLADQLLLPLALAGGGAFTTTTPSGHLRTNAQVIEKFLPVACDIAQIDNNNWTVEVD